MFKTHATSNSLALQSYTIDGKELIDILGTVPWSKNHRSHELLPVFRTDTNHSPAVTSHQVCHMGIEVEFTST